MDERTAQASGLMKAWQPLTRGGQEYRIYAVYKGQRYPIHGAIKLQDGKWLMEVWDENGRHYGDWLVEHHNDLLPALPEKRTLKGWVNVYEDRIGPFFYMTKVDANNCGAIKRTACVLVEIPYTPGEGL